MKAAATAIVAVATCYPTAQAFQGHIHPHQLTISSRSTTSLCAKKKKKAGGAGGKGFGSPPSIDKEPTYSIEDKSYDSAAISSTQTYEEARSSMTDFFATYGEWTPLFRNVMAAPENDDEKVLASSFLSDVDHPQELWGISTLEQRNPWRLLPSKPTTNSSLATLATFLDEWQQSLLDIPLDQIITGDNDMHFLEEGRRTIACTRFQVLDEYHTTEINDDEEDSEEDGESGTEVVVKEYDWEAELFRTIWSEMAHLMSQDETDTGSMVLLPDHDKGLEYVRAYVESNFVQPLNWLGRHEDWEISAMERGSLAVRLLYKLSEIPDLNSRDSGGDEEIMM